MESKRCYGCMKLKTQSPICEHCGFNENIQNYPHQLPLGTVLREQYMVGKVLGQGGFGITYMGWDMSLETPVAIKEYYPNGYVSRECTQSLQVSCNSGNVGTSFQTNKARFLREAKTLARLDNIPGIVRAYNLFSENNTAYIIMEYVKGIDLRHYIHLSGGRLSVDQTLRILHPVMTALGKVHQEGLVHRDISPDNIMVLPDGSAKLLDFGAVREVMDANVEGNLAQSTEAILKHGFAPMEQYQKRGSLGPWTDVYAMCATVYYCVTGAVPPDAPERMLESKNVEWSAIPGLTQHQIEVLEKGMALLPKERIGTLTELCELLFAQPSVQEEQTIVPPVVEPEKETSRPKLESKFFRPRTESRTEEKAPHKPLFESRLAFGKSRVENDQGQQKAQSKIAQVQASAVQPSVKSQSVPKAQSQAVPKKEPAAVPVSAVKETPVPVSRIAASAVEKPGPSLEELEIVSRSRGESRSIPKVESRVVPPVESRSVPKVESKAIPKAESRTIPKVESKAVPKAESRTVPKVESRTVPKAEPKDVPKAESRVIPKAESKAVPKAESKPVPKVESRSVPKKEAPKPAPESRAAKEPQKAPAAEKKQVRQEETSRTPVKKPETETNGGNVDSRKIALIAAAVLAVAVIGGAVAMSGDSGEKETGKKEQQVAEGTSGSDVEAAIDRIGTVTMESLADIEAAEKLYEELNDKQKKTVDNYDVLTAARTEYDRLAAKVDRASGAIDAIGEVTAESGDRIAEAREAYDALAEDGLTPYVEDKLPVLQAAEQEYEVCCVDALFVSAQEKYAAYDYEAAKRDYDTILQEHAQTERLEEAKQGAVECVVAMAQVEFDAGHLEKAETMLQEAKDSYGRTTAAHDKLSSQLQNKLKQIRPQNGKMFEDHVGTGKNSLTVTGGSQDAIVKVESTANAEEFMLFYVRANEKKTINIKSGEYRVKYTCGDSWYSEESMFGAKASYAQGNETYSFMSFVMGSKSSATELAISLEDLEAAAITADKF